MTAVSSQTRQSLTSFVYTSPLSPNPHDVSANLASHCLRDCFGPTVQMVADGLYKRGPSTFRQLVLYLQQKVPQNNLRGSRWHTQAPIVDAASVRASLIVLIQHSMLHIDCHEGKPTSKTANKPNTICTYRVILERARWIQHYPKYLDYVRKATDETCAAMLQIVLLHGRLRTMDILLHTLVKKKEEDNEDNPTNHAESRLKVIDAFCKLVNSGLIERAPVIKLNNDEEVEFEGDKEDSAPPRKKVKFDDTLTNAVLPNDDQNELYKIIQQNSHYKTIVSLEPVWRVHHVFIHASLRAFTLGRLVAELYGHKVQSAGSLVTAALKLRAYQELVQAKQESLAATASDLTSFAPDDVIKFLPKPVVQSLESKHGGVALNLLNAWHELSLLMSPVPLVRKVGEDRYEVSVGRLLDYLRERVIHQIIQDRHGIVAARIVNILRHKGWLESETLADHAMVPAKETREHLHRLYRCRYIDLFPLPTTRQHNTSSCIYLWQVQWNRLLNQVRENVAMALWKMRLRRQHQGEMGRGWIERAQQAEEMDENEHESDKVNYQKFCLGLERLDCAIQHLDETHMILEDF
jgi:DNA-directed RNA polymerase III subunit RPC3